MPNPFLPTATALLLLATAAPGQTVLSGDHSVDGNLCVGTECTGSETFGTFDDLTIKGAGVGLLFSDTAGTSDNDWRLQANATSEDSFFITDVTGGTTPFKVRGTAPDNSLYVAADGDVGIGTSIPAGRLHIETTTQDGLTLRRSNATFGPQAWTVFPDAFGQLVVRDETTGAFPFVINPDAKNFALRISSDAVIFNAFAASDIDVQMKSAPGSEFRFKGDSGRVGLGTNTPTAPLHVTRSDNTAQILVEDTGASGAQEMFKLANNGGSFFTFENTAAGTEWFFVHEDAAPNRFIITDGVADGPEMTLTADGVLTVEGGFVAGATTLNVPDYVFEEDYALRPLSEVATFIAQNKHLPDVPSAREVAADGLDMTKMQMALLKKVEELTLYTLELEDARAVQADQIARLEDMVLKLASQ